MKLLFACTQYSNSPYAITGHPEHMVGCIRWGCHS